MRWQSFGLFYFGVGLMYAAVNGWTVLLLWQTLAITHAGLWVAMAAATSALPAIVVGLTGPEWGFGGRIGVWLMITGAAVAMLAPLFVHTLGILLAVGLAEGWINARIIPTGQAWLMSAISPKDAPRASTHFEMASRIGVVAGPIVAGALITTSGPLSAAFALALLYISSGVLWYGIAVNVRGTGSSPVPRKKSWRAVQHDSFLMIGLAVRSGANLLWPAFTVAIPLLVEHPWHAQALGYGSIRTLWGLSTVVGTWLVIPRLFKRLQLSYFLSWVVTGIAFWRIGLSRDLTTALLWVAVGAVTSPVVHVALDSHIGTHIEKDQQGAVFAIQRLVMAVVNLAGLLLITGMIRQLKPGPALSDAGLLMAGGALTGLILWIGMNIAKTRGRTPLPNNPQA